ncbi:hypothetical protein CMUST_03905 [Corynebacterium mustelae]|uniref:Uncharacterized protein n=1 Tax=Corynebacterium mustelae TaxID=571915 RepID=A0A0G3GX88_9CORY|nr:hypothetical protein [Corynebacterium mustelae]AKK05125.1 hypothetical protein CMUST_03905 [Corynebacterium mustelae]
MRVYIPATFGMLKELSETGAVTARSGWGFALTPALREFFIEGDDEDLSEIAFDDASRASLRLLAIGDETAFPHRRVVISTDVADSAVSLESDMGESVVKLNPAAIQLQDVAAIHVDVESSENATAAAIEAIDSADLGDEDAELKVGDALDNFLAWYDPSELNILVELL